MENNVRHFFYKKNARSKKVRNNCFWFVKDNIKYLVSYRTVVCAYGMETGYLYKFWNEYSATTINQINRFLETSENDIVNNTTGEIITGFNKKEWLAYPTEALSETVRDYIRPYLPTLIESERNDYIVKIIYD